MPTNGLAALTPRQITVLRNGLRIMALHALGDEDAAEDVVQESLLRALDAASAEIASDAVRLGAFVGGIARHVIADMRQRDARSTSLLDGQADTSCADCLDTLVKADERTLILRALAKLSVSDQALLRASFYEGRTPREIAFGMQESPEVVRKRKSRALEKLRDELTRLGHATPAEASKNGNRVRTAEGDS